MVPRMFAHSLALRVLPLSIAAFACGSQLAGATIIFDSFDAGSAFNPNHALVGALLSRQSPVLAIRYAVRFVVTGDDDALASITLPVSVGSNVPDHVLRVRLTSDAGGMPGTTLEILSENQEIWPPTVPPFSTITTLTSTAQPRLANGSSYWIVIEPTAFPNTNG